MAGSGSRGSRTLGNTLNQVANVITALAVLCGAIPLLLRAVHELGWLRSEAERTAVLVAEVRTALQQADHDRDDPT